MRIFISYGRGDALEFAHKLAAWLKAEGLTPWLDVDEGIPIGSPFDIRIELGIEGSDLLIAVLSPWSLRPEGFCRNELLFAQAKKRPIIPVRIADVTPPIQIISLNYLDACANPDGIFGELSKVIQQVAKSGQMTLHDWPALTTGLPWWADRRQLSFEEELARHGNSFTGREWLFAQIREWAAQPDSRLLLVTAEAGFGKSAISAQLTTRLNVRGVHFCSRSQVESCKTAAWLAGLAYQLAAQFPAYRDKLDLSAPDWNQPGESLFRALIAEPLRELTGHSTVEEPWVFVVDGLDESVAEAGRALADLLTDSAERIPDWLRIIVTSRPDENIIAQFKRDGVMSKHLDAEGTPNFADVTHYISERVAGLEHTGVIDRQFGTVDRLAHVAHGNFLFAKLTLDSLMDSDAACRLSLDEMGSLPSKLGGLYHAMFRKRFRDADAYDREILPLLDCLISARGPLPKDLLSAASGLDARAFQRGLRALSQFLGSSASGYRVFHQSLADWLYDETASGEFAASLPEGRKNLTAACWATYQQDPGRMPAYALLHSAIHLAESGRWDDLCQILTDLLFIQAKCEAGLVHDLVRDYNIALAALPEFREENEFLAKRDAAMLAYNEALREYATARTDWFRATERGEMRPDPPYPPLPPELRDESHTAIPEESSPRAARLRHFANFVSEHLVLLAQFPKDTLSLAFNYSEGGPVADQSSMWIGNRRQPTLERVPRPPIHPLRPQCLRTLEGHSDGVESVSVSPDGRRAVSASVDKTVRLWDLETGQCLRTLEGHGAMVDSVSVSPDGRRAVSGSWDNTIRLWDLETGQCLRTLEGHSAAVLGVSVSPDGRRAVSASIDKTVRLWDLETGQCLRILEGHISPATRVSVSPDGRRAVSGSEDKTIRLWDLETGQCLRTLEGHSALVSGVCISPDGRSAVSGSWDKTVRLWDLETGKCLRTLESHRSLVECVSISPDGRRAVSGSEDKTVRIWDLETGQCLRTLEGHSKQITSVSVSPDGRRAVSGSYDMTVRLWDLNSDQCLRTLEGHSAVVECVSVSPDGRRAVSAGGWDNTVRLWDLETGQCLRTLEGHSDRVRSVSVSPDGRCAVSGSEDKTVRLWDLETGQCQRTLEGHSSGVGIVSVSPDGRRAVSAGSWDNTIRLWDLETGQCLRTLEGHSAGVRSVCVSPDGRRAASASIDKTVRLWDLETGQCLRTLEGHRSGVESLSVSPDGRRAISGGGGLFGANDNTVRLWDLETGQCRRTLEGHSSLVWSVSICPDGRRALSGSEDMAVRLWDLDTGLCLCTLQGHSHRVTSVGISPDGRRAVSGSNDKTVRLWDLETGQCLAVYHAGDPVRSAAFSLNCGRIVCGTRNGQMHFLTPINFPPSDPPLITALRFWHFGDNGTAGRWDDRLAALCPWCGRRFPVGDDSRLLANCPHCAKPLNFNPFFVES